MSLLPRLDLHTHSTVSDGEDTPEKIVTQARAAGLAAVAITDHYDPCDPSYGRSAGPLLSDILATRARLGLGDSACVRRETGRTVVLVGVERGPRPLPYLPRELCPIIGSIHYLTGPYRPRKRDLFDTRYWERYRQAALRLAGDLQVDVIGHLTGYLPLGPLLPATSTPAERRSWEKEIAARFFSPAWYEAVFQRAVRSGVAIELHCATRTPEPEFVRLGLKLGVRFSLGSDAHSLEKVGDVEWGLDLLESLSASPASLLDAVQCAGFARARPLAPKERKPRGRW